MDKKICAKCGVEKKLDEFGKSSYRKDGHRVYCKECSSRDGRIYRENNLEKERARGRKYYHDNTEKVLQYQSDHKEEANARKYKYIQDNPEKRSAQSKKYYQTHKDARKEYERINRIKLNLKRKEYMNTHPQARIAHNLRTSMWRSITGRSKKGRMLLLVGCEWSFFLKHIESQFIEGMSWDNYGNKKGMWTIDHIKPLVSFDLTTEDQQKDAFNWRNCRPMWFEENASKSAYYNGVDYKKKKGFK